MNYLIPGRGGTLNCKLNWYPKFYNLDTLFVGSKILGTFKEVVSKLSNNYSNFIRFNFAYYLWGCIKINRLLSYPLRSLHKSNTVNIVIDSKVKVGCVYMSLLS